MQTRARENCLRPDDGGNRRRVNPLLYIIHEKHPSCCRLLHAMTQYTVYVENDIQPLWRACQHYRGNTLWDILLQNQGVDMIINKNKHVELPRETQMHDDRMTLSLMGSTDSQTPKVNPLV
jgi:hypothetical protein